MRGYCPPAPLQRPMPALNLIIADDHHLVRSGLCKLIAEQSDLHVAAQCRTGRETLMALDAHPCNVLLLDLSLPDMSGLDVLRTTRIRYPAVCVLVVSGYPERQFGINVLRAGAKGFIGKGVDEAELLRAIRIVARGSRYVGPELADLLVNGMDADSDQPTHNLLSAREFQIFCRLAEGRTVSEIAGKLALSIKTVSTYRTRLLDKMGMKTNADITTYAVRNSIVQ
jgi:two-component system, NarL family, invasion response regulator UvrY